MTKIELITKEDLEMLRHQILEDLKVFFIPKKKVVKEWMKSGEVRKMLNVSASSLQNMRINGLLKPKKIGGTYYYRTAEVQALFD
ncbi:helix-turn-helix domain-containing protein [Belliella aquatica]|uniref:Transcriptional regulator n=1 Tax=Belliella aquatica TaxID=1323734 RepID=A0ABQ1MD64_9BACT|nr:helix-turn-helix domain-containing protein [Belliella aquatica]MCH7406306.1 helix-turn-helix domain-containing protein [Belliella aquatica]GGC37757.1 transcriptional regulator [Belliella aquatica]